MAIRDTVDNTLTAIGSNLPGVFGKSKKAPDTRRQSCEAQGGTWDPVKEICIPKEEPKEEPKTETTKRTPPQPKRGTLVTGEQGRVAGFINSKGQFVADRETAIAIRQKEIAEENILKGTKTAEQKATEFRQAQQLQQAIAKIGQVGELTPAEEADINFSQAAAAGAAGVIPGLIGGATTGALVGGVAGGGVGSTITAPVGAALGAAAGATTSFFSGIIANIKEQQRGELQAARIELTNAQKNMRQLAMLATQDPANADIFISQYNAQLTRVHQSRRQTQAEVQGDLNAWMEDGREQLTQFDDFLRADGVAEIYGQKLAIALQRGTPLSTDGDQLFLGEQ